MNAKLFLLPLPLLFGAACGSDHAHTGDHDHDHGGAASSALPAPSADAVAHDLRCGCAIDAVGACGEYIDVDGKFVELRLPGAGLGDMPFCGKDGLSARVDGAVEDGVFVATTFAYVD